MQLHHLMLQSGELVTSQAAEIPYKTMDLILPAVLTGCGALPGCANRTVSFEYPNGLDTARPYSSGYFEIHKGEARCSTLLLGMAVWDAEAEAEAWDYVQTNYAEMGNLLRALGLWQPLPAPPALPWLTTWLGPGVLWHETERVEELAFLARCVGWTLLPPDRSGGPVTSGESLAV